MAEDPISTETISVRHDGRLYRIERTHDAMGPGTVREFWPGRGVIGNHRTWLGHRQVARPTWYAAINPTGQPAAPCHRTGGATALAPGRDLLAPGRERRPQRAGCLRCLIPPPSTRARR